MEQVSYFINKLLFIDLLYCARNADHTKKVCEKYTSKSKCPFPSARTLSPTFVGLYSQFQFAFEKLLWMIVCKFGMSVAKFKCLSWSSFRQFTISQLCKFWLPIIISHCSLFNHRKYSERTSKKNFGTLQWTFRTYKRTFEVIFQKQIEIESKSFDKRQSF